MIGVRSSSGYCQKKENFKKYHTQGTRFCVIMISSGKRKDKHPDTHNMKEGHSGMVRMSFLVEKCRGMEYDGSKLLCVEEEQLCLKE